MQPWQEEAAVAGVEFTGPPPLSRKTSYGGLIQLGLIQLTEGIQE